MLYFVNLFKNYKKYKKYIVKKLILRKLQVQTSFNYPYAKCYAVLLVSQELR